MNDHLAKIKKVPAVTLCEVAVVNDDDDDDDE